MSLPKNKSLPGKVKSKSGGLPPNKNTGVTGMGTGKQAKLPKGASQIGGRHNVGTKDGMGQHRSGGGGKGGRAGGGKGPDGMPKYYGGRAGYKGVRTRAVKRLTNGVIREEMRDLKGQAREVRADSKEQTRNAKRDYQRGNDDLNYVHGETGDYLNSLAQRTQSTYNDQANQQAQANAALQTMLGNTYSGAQQGAQGELDRLGIGAGGNFGQMQADAANSMGVAAQSGANAASTLGMSGANAALGQQLLAGMNQGSYMQGMGQNLNARNDAIQQIRTDRIDNMNQVRHAMQDAQKSRKDVFFQLLQQLQQTGWDQYVQAQQLHLQRKALHKH